MKEETEQQTIIHLRNVDYGRDLALQRISQIRGVKNVEELKNPALKIEVDISETPLEEIAKVLYYYFNFNAVIKFFTESEWPPKDIFKDGKAWPPENFSLALGYDRGLMADMEIYDYDGFSQRFTESRLDNFKKRDLKATSA